MTLEFKFDNAYAALPDRFYSRLAPTPVAKPGLVRVNHALARALGLDPDALETAEGLAVLAGNRVPEGADPLAQAYAGHQFGGWVPQLGDGRAILLGEIIDSNGGGAMFNSRARAARPTAGWATAAPGSARCCANTWSPRRCTRSASRRPARWPPSPPASR
jgi:uncharacterized protein YdiU (UPF0061 family)